MIVSRVLIIVIFWIFCCWLWSCSCCDLIDQKIMNMNCVRALWIFFFWLRCVQRTTATTTPTTSHWPGWPKDRKQRERERESNYFQSLIKISWRWRWLKINLLDECVSRFRVRQQKINKCQCQWFHLIFLWHFSWTYFCGLKDRNF